MKSRGKVDKDTIPRTQEAIERRDVAATAAADALQEALVTESVIRNLSKFSDLCSLSKASNPLPTVDLFLAVYGDNLKWKKIAEPIATDGADEAAFWEKSTNGADEERFPECMTYR